jgi:choice-of-anchor B domain-containing protein
MKILRHTLILTLAFHALTARGGAAETATVLGQYTSPHPGQVADLWGYVDPNTNREYALLGERNTSTGVIIIDVTDPTNPTAVGLASTVQGVDFKVWKNFLYVVTGYPVFNGGRIFDLTDLTSPRSAGAFESAHTMFIDDRGLMYLSLTGGTTRDVRIYDVDTNPVSPRLLWFDGIGEAHQAYVVGTTLYDFHGFGGTRIYDTTAPTSPFLLGVITTGEFHHSGAPTEDGKYLFITHELVQHPKSDMTVWNIEDPANAYQVAEIADSTATVHNLYIIGDYAYVSYYTAGFRVYDVSDPRQPVLAVEYDTSSEVGDGFRGCYGVYPFTPSGHIYTSDVNNGLFVFSFSGASASIITSFDAVHRNGRVRMSWNIGATAGLQGFNVYRSRTRDGAFDRLNSTLLPADGAFAYEDTGVEYGATYWYYLGVMTAGGELRSRVLGVPIPVPRFALYQNAPNPFNPSTTLPYAIPASMPVELAVYNVAGQRIRTLVNDVRPPGPHSEVWDGRDDRGQTVAAGVYFARLSAGGEVDTKRMVFVK